MITLRHQIYTLEKSIKYIENELAAVENQKRPRPKRKQKESEHKREDDKWDASSLEALRTWRKEIQRRLRVGDYLHRKQGKGLFQALGNARDIPNMPQLGRGRDDDDTLRIHTRRLLELAQPLCVCQSHEPKFSP